MSQPKKENNIFPFIEMLGADGQPTCVDATEIVYFRKNERNINYEGVVRYKLRNDPNTLYDCFAPDYDNFKKLVMDARRSVRAIAKYLENASNDLEVALDNLEQKGKLE